MADLAQIPLPVASTTGETTDQRGIPARNHNRLEPAYPTPSQPARPKRNGRPRISASAALIGLRLDAPGIVRADAPGVLHYAGLPAAYRLRVEFEALRHKHLEFNALIANCGQGRLGIIFAKQPDDPKPRTPG